MSNISMKLGQLQTALDESSNRANSALNSISRIDDEFTKLRNEMSSRLQKLEEQNRHLQSKMSELAELVDEGIDIEAPTASPQPKPETSEAEPVTASDDESSPTILYEPDGSTLVLSGPGVKEWVEAKGHTVVGTVTRNLDGEMAIYLKLRRW